MRSRSPTSHGSDFRIVDVAAFAFWISFVSSGSELRNCESSTSACFSRIGSALKRHSTGLRCTVSIQSCCASSIGMGTAP